MELWEVTRTFFMRLQILLNIVNKLMKNLEDHTWKKITYLKKTILHNMRPSVLTSLFLT